MVVPPDKRLTFFVFVIESPSAVDRYHRRTEGEVIRQAVNLNQISCTSKLAINVESFVAAIRVGLHEEMEANPGLIPVLHISAHGSGEGIQLSRLHQKCRHGVGMTGPSPLARTPMVICYIIQFRWMPPC